MSFELTLTLEYGSDTEWRWVLGDAAGRFVQDYEVSLDPADPLYRGFVDLPERLDFMRDVRPAEEVLAELGGWIGEKVFGRVGEALLRYEQAPARVVQVRVPPAAQNLLFRPFELARLHGRTLVERGFRLVYTVAHAEARHATPKDHAGALRILGVFSLPDDASPLNLRQERYRLQQLVRNFAQQAGQDLELRVVQYGTTRDQLEEVLQEAPGWDVVHFSGHGLEGELLLERPNGMGDRVTVEQLTELLRSTERRLKLLTLSACYSGAADIRAAGAQIGLEAGDSDRGAVAHTLTILPSLGQRLAEELDCAVMAMRYPVRDTFATDLALQLYDRLLKKKQPLPQALQQALADALDPDNHPPEPDLSRITPLLFGARAADLRLTAPAREVSFQLPGTGLFGFPDEPERFVGRLLPMLRASRALAPASGQTGVLFYGMAGAGKTVCAVELAHRYDRRYTSRFVGFAWYKVPDEDHDITGALTSFGSALESQLPGLELVGQIDNPETFRRQVLPRLRGLMDQQAILIVLDNLEGLLTRDGGWRDARWGELVATLLDHKGLGRLIMTSRRVPLPLAQHPRLQREPIHALSFPESVLLARELEHLRALFADAGGRAKLRRVLLTVQGHPKLMELADALAANPEQLEAQLARAVSDAEAGASSTAAFFTTGESRREEDAFVRVLHGWTEGIAATLGVPARLLAYCLARMEDNDRTSGVLESNWKDVLKRLTGEWGGAPAPEPVVTWVREILAGNGGALQPALRELTDVGLVEVRTSTTERLALDGDDFAELLALVASQNPAAALETPGELDPRSVMSYVQAAIREPLPALQAWLDAHRRTEVQHRFLMHPGVAEALRAAAPGTVCEAVDVEVGDYFLAMLIEGLERQSEGGGSLAMFGARNAAPYLLRSRRWEEAAGALERLLNLDTKPSTLAFAIPVLRVIVEKTDAAEENVGVLSRALIQAGRYGEAEKLLRDLLVRFEDQGNNRNASVAAGDLVNLLIQVGRFEEGLELIDDKVEFTRRAGLGPWTQLSDEGRRLRVLAVLGRYREVLEEVERHRERFQSLPESPLENEAADPYNVREGMLETGCIAAAGIGDWKSALRFNAEVVASQRRRGLPELEIAGTRFNDYFPLLNLGRYAEARGLLEECREVFQEAGSTSYLGKVYSALANLESREDRPENAIRFEQTAIRYKYVSSDPEACATSHCNLANYIKSSGGSLRTELAHRLADALLCLQTKSGSITTSFRNLVAAELPADPPSFVDVVAEVEQLPGVAFAALFAGLPQTYPSGDAALRALWEQVAARREEQAELDRMLATLPAAVGKALASGGGEALSAALDALPAEQQEAVFATLQEVAQRLGFDPELAARRSEEEALRDFEPLLAAVAAVAKGQNELRDEVAAALAEVEANGWLIADAARRIWAGERDPASLVGGLDGEDTALVMRILELLA